MKRICTTAVLAFTLITFSCNSGTDNEDRTDSIGNEATPGNSTVTPNSNAAVVPTDNQTNANGIDTALVDSIATTDSIKR